MCLLAPVAGHAQAIRFGVPPWPGVTVKTEVVCQILESMGYETEQFEIGPPIIYKGLTSGDVDAYVAAWLPAQNDMYLPLKEKNAIDTVALNLDEAGIGLAVSKEAWEGGVHSVADLDKFADKFGKTIYGIEVGSGMQVSTEGLIKNDVAGLGDWQLSSTTTPIMLTSVQDRIRQGEWVVFHGWQPHWMNIKIDMKFLEGVPGTEKLISKSFVWTLASNDCARRFPRAYAFLKQFYVKGQTQSEWIYSFGYEKKKPEAIAKAWIAAHLDTVAVWLKGVNATDGTPAIEALRKDYE
jgi:glycine betaine/proline transport system substrate-binding protein